MKIKEICEKTGLTDRTVRFYIQEQLIAPFYTENYLGRKSFDFSEQDLQKLESIATLRSFGFTVEEIKELLSSGTDNQQIVAAVQRRTEEDLGEMKYRHTVLSELDASEQMDVDTLVKRLSGTGCAVKNESARMNRRSFLAVFKSCLMFLAVWLPIMIAISILLFKFYVLETPTISPIFFVCTFLCFFPSTATILFFPRLGGARKSIRVILIGLCVICLPLGAFFSAKSVIVCDHKYQSYRTTVEATCQNSGEVVKKCKKCGDFKVQSVEKLSHKAVVVEGITPTCSTSGISEGSVCLHCDTVLVEQSVLPPTNIHTPVKIGAAVAATCKDTGLTEGSRCSVCNKTLVAQTVVPVTNDHIPVTDAAVSATCKATGLTEGSHCSVCDKVLVAQTVVSKTEDHMPVTDAAVSATCKNTGLTEGSHCSVCNKTLVAQTVVPKTEDHTVVIDQAIEPTCTAVGKTEGSHCSLCNTIFVSQQTLAQLSHSYEHNTCIYCGARFASTGLEFTKNDTGCALTGLGSCTDEYIVIPSTYNGMAVTEIARGAIRAEDRSIREIIIPDSVKTIRYLAISVSNFCIIEVGKNATIEENAFEVRGGCELINRTSKNVTSLVFYSNLEYTPRVINNTSNRRTVYTDDGFIFVSAEDNTYLCGYFGEQKDLVLPADFEGKDYVIASLAFFNSKKIEKVVLGNGVLAIGESAFASSSLTEIDLSGKVTEIPFGCFMECQYLESINIPDTVKTLSHQCFYSSGLKTVTIGKGVTTIQHSAFSCDFLDTLYYNATNCTYVNNSALRGFKHVVIGKTVETIPESFMYKNSSLVSVTFEENGCLKTISAHSFQQTSIIEITISETVSVIGNAFYGCNKLKTIFFNATNCTASNAFNNCNVSGGIVFTVGKTVTRIPAKLFKDCTIASFVIEPEGVLAVIESGFTSSPLKNIDLPTTVASFDRFDFELASLSIASGNPYYKIVDSCLVRMTDNALIAVIGPNYVIPASVTKIIKDAFYKSGATEIVIPETVLRIENGALTSADAVSVSLYFIGNSREEPTSLLALFGKENRTGFTAVSTYFFYNGRPIDVKETFYLPSNFSELVLMGGDISKDSLAFVSPLKTVTLTEGVNAIDAEAFSYCTGLVSIAYIGSTAVWHTLIVTEWPNTLADTITVEVNGEVYNRHQPS